MTPQSDEGAVAGQDLGFAAAYYAARGWHVFPAKPRGKEPLAELAPRGLLSATSEVDQVRAWWQQEPTANIAIRTGEPSGVWVLDVDARHGGDKMLAALELRDGALPPTATASTGGGLHKFFAYPGHAVRSRSDALGRGLDVKGDGGYVIAAPSTHPSGELYWWQPEATPDHGIAMAPSEWLEQVTEQDAAPAPVVADVIAEGQRDTALASLAGTMRRRGMAEAEITAALRVTNETRCRPPLPLADVLRIARSVSRYEPDQVTAAVVVGEPLGFTRLREFIAVREVSARPLLGTPDETVIVAGGDMLVYGAGGAGKTTLTIDATCHLASGRDWIGLAVPRPVTVTMIENEGPRGKFREKFNRKVESWTGAAFVDRVHVLDEPWARFTFSDPNHREQLAAFLNQTESDLLISGPVSTIGMIGGGTPDEINQFMALLGETRTLLDRPVAWWGVHHENRAGQVSGAWERVPDTLLHVTPRGNGNTRLFWQKARWSSELHGTTTHLVWADGATYVIAEPTEPVTADRVREEIVAYTLENGGTTWNKVEASVGGNNDQKRDVRAALLADGTLRNTATGTRFILWHRDDPAAPPHESAQESAHA